LINTFLQQQIFKQQPKTLLEMVFYTQSMPRLCKWNRSLAAINSLQQMVMAQKSTAGIMGYVRESPQPVKDEHGSKGHCWDPLPATTGEDIMCVISTVEYID
jgi:hypothetical protein